LLVMVVICSSHGLAHASGFVSPMIAKLNRHVHLHCCITDGLFDPGEDGQVRFHQAPALTTAEMAATTTAPPPLPRGCWRRTRRCARPSPLTGARKRPVRKHLRRACQRPTRSRHPALQHVIC